MNKQIDFIVIDNNTGKQADISEIALKEDWAKGLIYCDMEGFAITEDGHLILLDECGNFAYCPYDRFTIQFENSVVLTMSEHAKLVGKVRQEFEYEYKDKVVLSREEYDNLKLEIQQAHNKGVRVGFDLTKYKENSIEQARKETAREIIEMFSDKNYITEKDLIKAIAKRYGVKIKND